MAVSCPEVMYGAYYPYLYGRGAARGFHHAPFQYERPEFAASPGSPRRARAKEEERSRASADSESEGEAAAAPRARAQYVSANCVVFTHYAGDVHAVVDEHFARALAADKHKESVPMVSRNLPASFFNAAAGGGGGGGGGGVELYEYDPWHQHYAGYGGAARHAAEYHAAQAHHSMAGYPGLLLPRPHLHAQYKPDWPPQHLDPAACAPYSYPAVPGLEPQVQDTSKDLYWF